MRKTSTSASILFFFSFSFLTRPNEWMVLFSGIRAVIFPGWKNRPDPRRPARRQAENEENSTIHEYFLDIRSV
jgi:hypothetical protein